jgi:VIT1/CCC1 family predicted Fe2+/Mn2+ transporter
MFILNFHKGQERDNLSYSLGGLIPMIAYFAYKDVNHALFTSVGLTGLILLVFGYVEAVVTGFKGRDAVIDSLAAVAAGTSHEIVRGFNQIRPVHP